MQRETKKSGLARSVSLKGVRKAANSLKKATVDIVDKVGDKVGDIGHTDLDISERTATAMAISGMSIKRKPSIQRDIKTEMRANQSVASNGLADLDFSLSTDSMPRSLSNPSDGDFTSASNISTFHDPLLDEFSPPAEKEITRNTSAMSGLNMGSNHPNENGIDTLPSTDTLTTTNTLRVPESNINGSCSVHFTGRRRSIGLNMVVNEIKDPESCDEEDDQGDDKDKINESDVSSIGSDFDVDELLADDSDDDGELKANVVTTKPQNNSDSHLINNYKKSIKYVGTDSFGDAVFVIYARDLPLDVKTNYQYFKVMDRLKDFFEKFIIHHLNGPKQKFVAIFITGMSAKENLPKSKWAETAVKSSNSTLHERMKLFVVMHLSLVINAYIQRTKMFLSSDFHKTKLVKCSCMKSLAKHEIRIKIKLPEDLDAYDRKKTRA